MLSPKKVKFRKQQKGRTKGVSYRGCNLNYGEFGLQAIECGRISSKQIEAARIAMTRHVKRFGKDRQLSFFLVKDFLRVCLN